MLFRSPFFEELTTESYEHYSELDELGRCGVAEACLGLDTMSTDARESIGHIKPTGWKSVKYDFVEGGYLYNRCHLIGYQLSGENANKLNLITGTRAFNVDGMLPFEDMVADYIKETGNHVMYRVTPHFEGDEFVARGVYMEAKSVEDDGEGVEFNVYVYNKQRGVIIDYVTGEPRLSGEDIELTKTVYSVIKETGIFHREWCIYADSGKRELWYNEASEMERLGYKPCSLCLN